MNIDKIEIISEQLLALTKLWHLLLASTCSVSDEEISEELLLEILETKQFELQECLESNSQ
ncbi:MAG TPA: hypothetical protein VFC41_04495 [Anaerovoracaceae bacterium]|nr:hypothetical protein [Anaerovoracaceae bacterium]